MGKTCVLARLINREFKQNSQATVGAAFQNYFLQTATGSVQLQIWDTAGQEELENIRTLSYANTSVFLLCFSVVDKASYDNIEQVWLPELAQFVQNPTILLVGTKTDLRDDPAITKKGPVLTPQQGKAKAQQIGAIGYVECSAIKNKGVKEVFDTAIQFATSTAEGGCACLLI